MEKMIFKVNLGFLPKTFLVATTGAVLMHTCIEICKFADYLDNQKRLEDLNKAVDTMTSMAKEIADKNEKKTEEKES